MSYQAITDIIVNNATLQNLQSSNTVKDSPKTTSESSFSDLVSFYKNETASDVKDATPKEDMSSEDKITSVDNKSVEEVPSENNTQINEKKIEKEDKVKLVKEFTEAVKDDKEINTVKKELKSEEKKDKRTLVVDKSKKSDKKDFSRIDEIVRKDPVLDDVSKFAATVQNKFNEKTEVKSEGKLQIEPEIIPVDENQMNQTFIQMNVDTQADSKDFSFEQKQPSEKNQLNTIDKTGKITVEDLRTEKAEEITLEKKSDLKITEIKQTNENTAVMTMDLNQEVNSDVLSLNNQTAGANGSNFQAMLNNQIQNSAPEFVKAGNLVLKDNNQGTINLVIHPDDLGNVKIHLSLDGKSISGQITVATKEAMQVFKDNAETLREAFIKSGFDGANFDVAFNNGGSFNQSMEFTQQNDGSDIFAKNVYKNNGGSLDSELEAIIANSEEISNYSVNIIA